MRLAADPFLVDCEWFFNAHVCLFLRLPRLHERFFVHRDAGHAEICDIELGRTWRRSPAAPPNGVTDLLTCYTYTMRYWPRDIAHIREFWYNIYIYFYVSGLCKFVVQWQCFCPKIALSEVETLLMSYWYWSPAFVEDVLTCFDIQNRFAVMCPNHLFSLSWVCVYLYASRILPQVRYFTLAFTFTFVDEGGHAAHWK